jgi:hypothetical protein
LAVSVLLVKALRVVTFPDRTFAEVTLAESADRVDMFPVSVLLAKAFRVVTLPVRTFADVTFRVRTPSVVTFPV